MSYLTRNIVPGYVHHIVQRGVRRQKVYLQEEDFLQYQEIFVFYLKKFDVLSLGYCQMDNHNHHAIIPSRFDDLSLFFKRVNQIFAREVNKRMDWTGHLWQGKLYISAVDHTYNDVVLRYIDNNPVRAGMEAMAVDYRWSSARMHCGMGFDPMLKLDSYWAKEFGARTKAWDSFLREQYDPKLEETLRANTYRGFPCGEEGFIDLVGEMSGAQVRPEKRGRKSRIITLA